MRTSLMALAEEAIAREAAITRIPVSFIGNGLIKQHVVVASGSVGSPDPRSFKRLSHMSDPALQATALRLAKFLKKHHPYFSGNRVSKSVPNEKD